MNRVVRGLALACAFGALGGLAAAPLQEAYAQVNTRQVRAKKPKAQRALPAARPTTPQATPSSQARTPAYDPMDRTGGSGGGSGY
jgi:hypothetical protein